MTKFQLFRELLLRKINYCFLVRVWCVLTGSPFSFRHRKPKVLVMPSKMCEFLITVYFW